MGSLDLRKTRSFSLVLLAAAVMITGAALVYWLVLPAAGRDIGQAVVNTLKQSNESGAYAAASAASTAQADHISYSNLTISTLNAKVADETWVSATTNAVTSGTSQKFIVSVESADHPPVTAMRPFIQCVYGLSVASASDPVIQEDQLPGVGTYLNSAGTLYVGSGVTAPSVCEAATAPTAGWTRANPATLQELAAGR